MDNMEKRTITESQLYNLLMELCSKAAVCLIPILIYSVVQLVRYGNQKDYLFLLVCSILSIAAIFGYIITILIYGIKKKKSIIAMSLTFFALVPWIFASYLVFFRGFWSLKELAIQFSIYVIFKAIIFVALGYTVVSNLHKITEVGKHISDESLIIKEE